MLSVCPHDAETFRPRAQGEGPESAALTLRSQGVPDRNARGNAAALRGARRGVGKSLRQTARHAVVRRGNFDRDGASQQRARFDQPRGLGWFPALGGRLVSSARHLLAPSLFSTSDQRRGDLADRRRNVHCARVALRPCSFGTTAWNWVTAARALPYLLAPGGCAKEPQRSNPPLSA